MSCCTKFAIAPILARGEGKDPVRAATSCLIAGEAFSLPLVKFEYHVPISRQLLNSFRSEAPPGGKNAPIMCPATPSIGGISSSFRIPLTSLTTHCQPLLPLCTGLD